MSPQASPVLAPEAAAPLVAAGALVVDLRKPEVFAAGHVPGAVPMTYASLVRDEAPVGGLLPRDDALTALLSSVGLAPGRPVVAYDDEGNGRAGRLVWTLNAVGHRQAAILDGGFEAWREAGLQVEHEARAPAAGHYAARATGEAVAERDWILEHLGDPEVVLVDTRSAAEYRGEDVRSARGGHIPGAVHFDWVAAMDPARHRRVRPRDALLAELAALGVTPDREVVAYCQTHHRSSHTYVVLKALGFPRVRGYPGAWSDWGNRRDTPVTTGERP